MLYFDNGATTFPKKEFLPNDRIYFNPNSDYAMSERKIMLEAEASIKECMGIKKDNGVVLWFSSATNAVEWLVNKIRLWNKYTIHCVKNYYFLHEHKSIPTALQDYGANLYYPLDEVKTLLNDITYSSINKCHYFLFCQLANQLSGHVFNLKEIKQQIETHINSLPEYSHSKLFLLSDATAFVGKANFNMLPFTIEETCDAVWFSGHKFHVPTGIGAMWISQRLLSVLFSDMDIPKNPKNQHGLVRGTPSVALIKALENGMKYFHECPTVYWNTIFRENFIQAINFYQDMAELPETTVVDNLPETSLVSPYVCGQSQCVNTVLVRFHGIKAQHLATWLASQQCYISTANSACEKNFDFTVLHGLGIKNNEDEYVRITFDKLTNSIEDVETLVGLISQFYLDYVKTEETQNG